MMPDYVTPLPQGYGVTLGTINCLAVLTSIFQAIPSLGVQVRRAWRGGGGEKGPACAAMQRIYCPWARPCQIRSCRQWSQRALAAPVAHSMPHCAYTPASC